MDRVEEWNRDDHGAMHAGDATRFANELAGVVDVLEDVDKEDVIVGLIRDGQWPFEVMNDMWQGAPVEVECCDAKRTAEHPLVARATVTS